MAEITPKQQRSLQTHQNILAAAQACFAQNGFDSTGVAEICTKAGISKGAFYHHFSSKQAIYLELLNQWLEEFDVGIQQLRQQAENVPAALRSLSAIFPHIFEIAAGQLPILFDFWAKAAREPHLWQATVEPFERYQTVVEEMITEGIAEGSIKHVDPRQTAMLLISVGVGALLQGLLAPQPDDWGIAGQQGIDQILRTIERNDS